MKSRLVKTYKKYQNKGLDRFLYGKYEQYPHWHVEQYDCELKEWIKVS